MKKILIGLVIVVIVIAGGVAVLYSNLDKIVKEAVETAGSQVTAVPVTLNGVTLELTDGKAALTGLKVANPAEFKTDYAISLGGVAVAIDPGSVGGDTILVKNVTIDAPKVIYELGSGGSNINAIQQNVESFTKQFAGSGGSSSGSSDSGSSAGGGEEGPKVVIENLRITGGRVAVSADIPGLSGEDMGVNLPDIHLTDIGKDDGGASPAEVAAEVMAALNDSIMGAISSGLPNLPANLDDAKKLLESGGNLLGGAASGATEALQGATEGAGGAVEDAAEGAGKVLKGLFGSGD